ncbi:peroxisomal membrane protein 11A isoform X2 [Scophthalmus maximus]|uniref:peroxisomal membrane protein 11A isoform X2 n=1 Tax=Scophthalmus maximus TaxID=52904 RepID=UPI001FA8D683|nr:peroxisomal membrane protein 11A isoform X2 [Scophthalmus maximus]
MLRYTEDVFPEEWNNCSWVGGRPGSDGLSRLPVCFRATQFACALSTHVLKSNPDRRDLVAKLQDVEANMNAGRKLFRLGNTINSIEAANRSMQLSDRVLCLCLTAANVSRALYSLCDNVLWASSVGLIRDINKECWSLQSSRYYLLSLIMNLTRDFYVVLQLIMQRARDKHFRQKMSQHVSESPEVAEVVIPQLDALLFLLFESLKSHPSVALDTLKNICDLFGPLNKLGIYQTNAGVVACCGLISSMVGILTFAKPNLNINT